MASSRHGAYGLCFAVNFEWPWCPQEFERPPELQITLGNLEDFEALSAVAFQPHAARPHRNIGSPPVVKVERSADSRFRISYADGAQFVISDGASRVAGISRSALTLDDLLVYLQGPIFGFTLRLRGKLCLHASAVEVDGRAIAVVGSAGMGKSTSAATFARMGLPVFTDDVLAMNETSDSFDVQPGLPRILLWPESVAALFGDADALPRIVSTWDKRYLDLGQSGYQFAPKAARLAAIYVLGDRLGSDEQTRIDGLEGSAALLRLIANTYANDFLDSEMRARELTALTRLMTQVPIRHVRAQGDRTAIPRVCEAIIADAQSLRTR